jgi:hypothetical protein
LQARGCKLGYGQYLSTLLLTRGLGNWVASQNVGNQFRLGAAKLQMRMNPNEFGKKLGIGVRVAGRIAKQRAQEAARAKDATQQPPGSASQGSVTSPTQNARAVYEPVLRSVPNTREIRAMKEKTHKLSRAAGRGIGGFLRPFGRVGGILWLEVTGFFFGLFGLYFAVDLWRTRLNYATGPQHSRFLIAAGLTAVFGYLSVSAFWRAQRR